MIEDDPFASPPDEAQAEPVEDQPQEDAFAEPPAEEPPAPVKKAPAKKAAPKKAAANLGTVGTAVVAVKPNVLPVPDTGLSVTFKGGNGFSDPWIVPKYATVAEALVDLGVPEADAKALAPAAAWQTLMDRVQAMGKYFASKGSGGGSNGNAGGNGGGGQRQQRQSAPQAAQEAPNGEKRYCAHGEMKFRSGTSKAGKAYQAFFCNSGDRNDECRAQFLR